jgi:hypothetical protein
MSGKFGMGVAYFYIRRLLISQTYFFIKKTTITMTVIQTPTAIRSGIGCP